MIDVTKHERLWSEWNQYEMLDGERNVILKNIWVIDFGEHNARIQSVEKRQAIH